VRGRWGQRWGQQNPETAKLNRSVWTGVPTVATYCWSYRCRWVLLFTLRRQVLSQWAGGSLCAVSARCFDQSLQRRNHCVPLLRRSDHRAVALVDERRLREHVHGVDDQLRLRRRIEERGFRVEMRPATAEVGDQLRAPGDQCLPPWPLVDHTVTEGPHPPFPKCPSPWICPFA
jgi:hypothetical protein